VGQSSKTKKVMQGRILTNIPIFSKLVNFGPHIWRFWIALEKGYKPPKFCGPKFRNKKVTLSTVFELWSRFSRNWWTLVHICRHFEKPWEGSTKPQNIVDQSSKTRKLLKVPYFELWSRFSWNWWTLVHMFWHLWKSLKTFYGPLKFCGPKFKNNKVMHQKPQNLP